MAMSGSSQSMIIGVAVGVTLAAVIIIAILLYKKRFDEYDFYIQFIKVTFMYG